MGLGLKNIKTYDKTVRTKLLCDLKKDNKVVGILEEFDIVRGKARADVVAIAKNRVHAYEIKSDVDTLRRLPQQVRYYNQIFCTVTLVVGSEHAVQAMYLVPDWWGIVVARFQDGNLNLIRIREAKENKRVSYASLSELLRRDELIKLLNHHVPGGCYGSMSKVGLVNETRKEIAREPFIDSLSDILLSRAVPA